MPTLALLLASAVDAIYQDSGYISPDRDPNHNTVTGMINRLSTVPSKEAYEFALEIIRWVRDTAETDNLFLVYEQNILPSMYPDCALLVHKYAKLSKTMQNKYKQENKKMAAPTTPEPSVFDQICKEINEGSFSILSDKAKDRIKMLVQWAITDAYNRGRDAK